MSTISGATPAAVVLQQGGVKPSKSDGPFGGMLEEAMDVERPAVAEADPEVSELIGFLDHLALRPKPRPTVQMGLESLAFAGLGVSESPGRLGKKAEGILGAIAEKTLGERTIPKLKKVVQPAVNRRSQAALQGARAKMANEGLERVSNDAARHDVDSLIAEAPVDLAEAAPKIVNAAANAEVVDGLAEGDPATGDFTNGESEGEGEAESRAGGESREARLSLERTWAEREQRWTQAMEHVDRTVRIAEDQTLRVRVDSELALEVALKGAGVEVMLEGSRQAIESMGDVKGDLQDALSQGGSQLGGFETRHSDLSEWDEESRKQQRRGDGTGDVHDAHGGLVSRVVRRGQLVDTVA